MGTGAGRYIGQTLNNTNPLRRDTVLIPAYSYLVLRFVTDNREYIVSFPFPYLAMTNVILTTVVAIAGLWAFHCHLAWHMAAGLLMQISSLPSKAAQLDIPQDIIDQCASGTGSS